MKRFVLLSLTIITASALSGGRCFAEAPATAPTLPELFTSDFSGGLDAWVMTDPAAWKIEDESGDAKFSLFGKSDYEAPVRSPHNMARIKELVVTDFELEVDAKQTGKEYGHRDLCFFFGYQDPSHFYYVHLATVADPHANSIFLVNGAPRVSIAQKRTNGTDWKTGYHRVRIERNTESGTIKVYFNDMKTPVMETVDKTFLYGEVGLGSFDDTGNFDNLIVRGVLHKPAE
ncbi:MAG: hypothetical protein JNK74_08520 [Candidatus Hydrogenedentes bacterium]|nr:hypothetical protein [Candidatus Hydrogenedentota bacterium]